MHACGHDCHVAILMGVAQVLAGVRGQLRGSVKFIFQPAEEMPPEGEDGGAKMMIAEGALEKPVPRAIFGLHVTSRLALGAVGYRPGAKKDPANAYRVLQAYNDWHIDGWCAKHPTRFIPLANVPHWSRHMLPRHKSNAVYALVLA